MKRDSKKQEPKKKKPALDVHTNEDVKRYIGAISEHFGGQVSAVAEQFGSLHEKLDANTEMIGDMKENIEIIKTNVEFLKSALRKKVDYQDFEALEKRVRLVEAKLRR